MSISDELWQRALNSAVYQFEIYARQDLIGTPEERREALSDALQHAIGLIQADQATRPTKETAP